MDRFPNAWPTDRDGWAEPPPAADAVLGELGLDAGSSVADVGRGDGHLALPAAEIVAPSRVYAVDVDGTCLDEIEAHALERGLENVTTISGDLRSLSTRLPERVDVVIVADTFPGVEAPTAFAEQVWRALDPGGRFVVLNWRAVPPEASTATGDRPGPPPSRRMTSEETASVVTPAGFEVAVEVDLPPHHYGLVFERAHDR